MKKLLDPIREKLIQKTPEEIVRQGWISSMTQHLGYPKSLLAVEKNLESLTFEKVPKNYNRRIDLVCFYPDDGLKPLLVIEFKAKDQAAAPQKQVEGYNYYLKAPFWAVIQGESIETFWFENGKVQSINFLPSFSQLLQKLSKSPKS